MSLIKTSLAGSAKLQYRNSITAGGESLSEVLFCFNEGSGSPLRRQTDRNCHLPKKFDKANMGNHNNHSAASSETLAVNVPSRQAV